jgi:cytochrome c peroxidase
MLLTPNINNNARDSIVALLEVLTAPCVVDRTCLNPWIIDVDDAGNFSDAFALIAQDRKKIEL